MILLVLMLIHGLGLTVATLIVSSDPTLVDMTTFVPTSHVVFYTATNVILAACIVALLRLIVAKRKMAILLNAIYCVLSIVFLVAWQALGMKSMLGTVVDSLPGIVGLVYFARSSGVKETLVRSWRS